MYELRRDKLRSLIKKQKLDAMLVTHPLNVSYLTGFTGDDSWLYLTPDRVFLISDPRYELQILEETAGVDPVIRQSGTSMYDVLKKLTGPSVNVGIEADSLTVAEFARLSKTTEALWHPVSSLVESLREIKDKTEIAAIRESVRIARAGFEVLRLILNSDMTEVDVRNELEYQMRRAGADDRGFPTIAASGERAALPHAVPTNRFRVGSGELLLIDWGAKKSMYVSDLTRVLVTARRPSAKLRKIYNVVLDAQRAALSVIRPGITGAEADAAAREVIERAGYGAAFNHGLGHGIGLFVHERGRLSRGANTPLKPGMVVTVEPGIYLPGKLGVRIEDDVLVTRDGMEILSEGFRKEFDEMFIV